MTVRKNVRCARRRSPAQAMATALGFFCLVPVAPAEPAFESEFCKAKHGEAVDRAHAENEAGAPAAKFGLALMRLQADEQPGDFVASPFSIGAAVEMALVGAHGETATEMAAALSLKGVPTGDALRRQASYLRLLNCPSEYRQSKIYTANRVYIAKGKELDPSYIKTLRDTYDITAGEADFLHHAEDVRREINAWVEQATTGKIKDLVAPKMLAPATRMMLVNAIYVKGGWKAPFDKHLTKPQEFHLDAKHAEKLPTMHVKGKEDELSYAAEPGYRVVSLPFSDNLAGMAVFVPDRVDGLKQMEENLTGEKLQAALAALKPHRVNLSLPKFKIDSAFDVKKALASLGMKRAFNDKTADFSGIDGGKDHLYVGAVAHKAFISVDETGLEAAAATAVMMAAGGMPPAPTRPIEVKVDRPFLFVVYEPLAKMPLFIGRVTKPTS